MSNGIAYLTWTVPLGALGHQDAFSYNIYAGNSAGQEGSIPAYSGVTGNSIAVGAGTVGAGTYYFQVTATNGNGESLRSNEVSADNLTVLPPPASPQIGEPTTGPGTVSLSWSSAGAGASYSIFEGTSAGGEASVPLQSGITDTKIKLSGVTNGITHFFTVVASNSAGTSGPSNEVSALSMPAQAPLVAPASLSAKGGAEQITLTWESVPGASSYNVYQGKSSGGESTTPISAGVTGTTITLSDLTAGVTYYFTVAAVGASGVSGSSVETSAVPSPAAPKGLTASSINGTVALSWSPVAGASSYNVYQGTSAGGEASQPIQSGITDTDATVSGLASGTTYYFSVAAVAAGVASRTSAEVSTGSGSISGSTNGSGGGAVSPFMLGVLAALLETRRRRLQRKT